MSPEERDRLTRLEVKVETQEQKLGAMDTKLDQLLEAAAMGKGAWWIMLKIGGIGVLILGGVAWLWDHVPHR